MLSRRTFVIAFEFAAVGRPFVLILEESAANTVASSSACAELKRKGTLSKLLR